MAFTACVTDRQNLRYHVWLQCSLWRLPLVLQYNTDTYIGAKEVVYLSYITLTHTSAGYIHGWIIDDEFSNQSLCFALVIKRKFWFGELCDKSLLRRNSLKHNSEVLGEPERHYKRCYQKNLAVGIKHHRIYILKMSRKQSNKSIKQAIKQTMRTAEETVTCRTYSFKHLFQQFVRYEFSLTKCRKYWEEGRILQKFLERKAVNQLAWFIVFFRPGNINARRVIAWQCLCFHFIFPAGCWFWKQ